LAIANGLDSIAEAIKGNFDQAFADAGQAFAELGNGNDALVFGSGTATAGGTTAALLGNDNIAAIFGAGGEATAGANLVDPGNMDLAAVFGDMLSANATGDSFLVDILPMLF
jgi:hypothetical protein